MKFRAASTAGTSSRSSAPALGPAPSPFSIPNLPGASSSSAAANKSNLLLASPPPSSTKKKSGGKRSKVRSPMIRSPLGFHKLNNSAHGSDEGAGSLSEASGSLSSSGGAGRKLMFSPRKRGGVGAKSNKSKSSSSRGSKSPVKSRDIYSPTPEKHSSATAPGSAIGFRGSISASKVQGSLRKERKRRKSSFAGSTVSTSRASGVAKSVPAIEPASSNEEAGGEDEHMLGHQPEPELKPAAVEFAYPTSDAVAVPGPNVLQHFHQLAISTSAKVQTQTHQAQLDSLGTHLLSLEDVLIPAAAQQENAAIKYHQARLQRDPTANASSIDICKSVRASFTSPSIIRG